MNPFTKLAAGFAVAAAIAGAADELFTPMVSPFVVSAACLVGAVAFIYAFFKRSP